MNENVNTKLVIDPITKTIAPKYRNQKAVYVAKGDRNSVLINFEMPQMVDGYDMSAEENQIQIHYVNMEKKEDKKDAKVSRGISLAESVTAKNGIVSFSWRIPNTATRYAGIVSIGITFERYDNVDGKVQETYSWSTTPYGKTIVWESLDNTAEVIERDYTYLEKTCSAIIALQIEEIKAEFNNAFAQTVSDAERKIQERIDEDAVQREVDKNTISQKVASAQESANKSELRATRAETARNEAENARDKAILAQNGAETARNEAQEAQSNITETVQSAKKDIENERIYAEQAGSRAQEAQYGAETARNEAQEAQSKAEEARDKAIEAQEKTAQKASESAVKEIQAMKLGNACVGSKTGIHTLRIDDISSVEHNIKVKASSENIVDISTREVMYFPSTIKDNDYDVQFLKNDIIITKNRLDATDEDGLNDRFGFIIGDMDEFRGKRITVSFENVKLNGEIHTVPLEDLSYRPHMSIYVLDSMNTSISSNGTLGKNVIFYSGTKKYITFTIDKKQPGRYLAVFFRTVIKKGDVLSYENIMVNIGEAKPYVEPVNLETVKLTAYGKNIFNYNIDNWQLGDIGDIAMPFELPVGCEVTISGKYAVANPNGYIYIQKSTDGGETYNTLKGDNNNNIGLLVDKTINNITLTAQEGEKFRFWNNTGDAKIFLDNIQIELGNTKTEHKDFIEPTEYTFSVDGTIEGISSISPTMTLINDAGIDISATYSKNINSVIDEQQAQIDELKALILNLTT